MAKKSNELRPWPADSVTRWPIEKIREYPNNPVIHSDEQIALIARSMERFGVTNPLLVDEGGEIIYGHGRKLAAVKAGIKELPVCVARGWTKEERTAYRILDNESAHKSAFDIPLLRGELALLSTAGFDLSLTGFTGEQLLEFEDREHGSDPEATPEPPVTPIVRKGDLWILGKHRLLCGDATSKSDVARLMAGEKAALMNTDPPYGVDYGDIANSRSRPASVRKGGNGKNYATHVNKTIENDDLDGVALQAFLESTIRTALPHLIANPAFYLWHPMLTQGTFFAAAAAAAAADILIHRQIIWVKPSLIMGRGDYHWRHELCFYGWIRGKRCAWLRGRDQDTVWEIGRENDNIHPTQKPTALFTRPIENHTKSGDLVYEPFSGSGTQIIAAEMTARRCNAIEIAQAYVEVAVERWQTFAEGDAILEGDGRDFDTIKRERLRSAKGSGRSRRQRLEARITSRDSG